jgi:hypothetical protein
MKINDDINRNGRSYFFCGTEGSMLIITPLNNNTLRFKSNLAAA